MLNTDVAIQILLLLDSLQDLRSTILSARVFLDAYQQRRHFITGAVLCREIPYEGHRHGYRSALIHTDSIIKRLSSNVADVSIMLYEGLRPLVFLSDLSRRNQDTRKLYFTWTLELARMYDKIGPSASDKKLALLEEAYAATLTFEPNFDPSAAVPTAPEDPCRYLLGLGRRACIELIHAYYARTRLRDALQVQKSVLQRLELGDSRSDYRWGHVIIKTYRAIGDFKGATSYLMSLYNIARMDRFDDRSRNSLTWARHLVAEYTQAGRCAGAARKQEQFLGHLQPGTQKYIAWARRLVVLQRRAGLMKRALSTQGAIWQQLDVTNACFFGWSRQLADEYRKVYRNSEALTVLEWMYREAKRQSTMLPLDENWKYHTIQSARTLAAEYHYNNRSQDAQSLLEQINGGEMK